MMTNDSCQRHRSPLTLEAGIPFSVAIAAFCARITSTIFFYAPATYPYLVHLLRNCFFPIITYALILAFVRHLMELILFHSGCLISFFFFFLPMCLFCLICCHLDSTDLKLSIGDDSAQRLEEAERTDELRY